jgi:hypothetical protein
MRPLSWSQPTLAAETDQQRVDRIFAAYGKADSPEWALGVTRDGEFIYRKGTGARPSRAVMVNGADHRALSSPTMCRFIPALSVLNSPLNSMNS